jgi:hypothetical protein
MLPKNLYLLLILAFASAEVTAGDSMGGYNVSALV